MGLVFESVNFNMANIRINCVYLGLKRSKTFGKTENIDLDYVLQLYKNICLL